MSLTLEVLYTTTKFIVVYLFSLSIAVSSYIVITIKQRIADQQLSPACVENYLATINKSVYGTIKLLSFSNENNRIMDTKIDVFQWMLGLGFGLICVSFWGSPFYPEIHQHHPLFFAVYGISIAITVWVVILIRRFLSRLHVDCHQT
jgi:hypothetical protein